MPELKRDPYLWAFSGLLLLATYALVWHGDITWNEGKAFVIGALSCPALLGWKKKEPPVPPTAASAVPPVPPVVLGLFVVALALPGCALFTKQNAKYALDLAQTLCIVAHAESDDQTVAAVCGIEEALYPDLRKLLSEQRAAVARAQRQGVCR